MSYNIFRSEFIDSEDSRPIKKSKPKVVYSHKRQTGKRIDSDLDKKRIALPAGKRISKNGKVYYEYRKSRSDIKGLGI